MRRQTRARSWSSALGMKQKLCGIAGVAASVMLGLLQELECLEPLKTAVERERNVTVE